MRSMSAFVKVDDGNTIPRSKYRKYWRHAPRNEFAAPGLGNSASALLGSFNPVVTTERQGRGRHRGRDAHAARRRGADHRQGRELRPGAEGQPGIAPQGREGLARGSRENAFPSKVWLRTRTRRDAHRDGLLRHRSAAGRLPVARPRGGRKGRGRPQDGRADRDPHLHHEPEDVTRGLPEGCIPFSWVRLLRRCNPSNRGSRASACFRGSIRWRARRWHPPSTSGARLL